MFGERSADAAVQPISRSARVKRGEHERRVAAELQDRELPTVERTEATTRIRQVLSWLDAQ